MLEVIGDKKWLAVCRFNHVFQSVELMIMEMNDFPIVGIDRTVCHLSELSGENGGIGGRDFIFFD